MTVAQSFPREFQNEMKAEYFEIIPCPRGRLAIMPRPRGGDWLVDEMTSIKAAGVGLLVSLLMPEEESDLELVNESRVCAEIGLKFFSYPIPDRSVPRESEFMQTVDMLLPTLESGGFLAVHCRAGIGRSSVFAAALLQRFGVTPLDAIARISLARGFEVPDTAEQRRFILELGGLA